MARNILSNELKRNFPKGDIHFNPDFHQSVVDLFPIIHQDERMLSDFVPELHIAARFRGDFYGLLAEQGVDSRYHQILTEFNGMGKSSDYDGNARKFLMFDVSIIEEKVLKPLLSKK